MRISVKVKAKSKKEYVEKIDDTHYKVAVKELPVKGQANKAIIEVLSNYFKIKKADINILKGEKSKQKIVEIT